MATSEDTVKTVIEADKEKTKNQKELGSRNYSLEREAFSRKLDTLLQQNEWIKQNKDNISCCSSLSNFFFQRNILIDEALKLKKRYDEEDSDKDNPTGVQLNPMTQK